MLKGIKKTLNIIANCLWIAVLVFAFFLVGVRLIGLQPYTVLSGSMEPAYHVGSIIYVAKCEPEKLEVGDPITYGMDNGTIVTHRIVEIIEPQTSGGGRSFITKGDANEDIDHAPVSQSRIVGKPLFSIPLMGYLSQFIQTPSGILIVAAFIVLILILTFLPDFLSSMKSEEAETKEKQTKSDTSDADKKADGEENKFN